MKTTTKRPPDRRLYCLSVTGRPRYFGARWECERKGKGWTSPGVVVKPQL